MPTIKVSEKTKSRILALSALDNKKPHDEIIEDLLDIAMGVSCLHKEKAIYMRIPLDKQGYIDMDKTFEVIDNINKGRESDNLITVCMQCRQASRYKF